MPATNRARASMVGNADGNYGRSMGKLKRSRAEETVLGQINRKQKRQNEQQRVLEVGFPLRSSWLFSPAIHPKRLQKYCQEIMKDKLLLFCSRERLMPSQKIKALLHGKRGCPIAKNQEAVGMSLAARYPLFQPLKLIVDIVIYTRCQRFFLLPPQPLPRWGERG
jgi:hypothetical protein